MVCRSRERQIRSSALPSAVNYETFLLEPSGSLMVVLQLHRRVDKPRDVVDCPVAWTRKLASQEWSGHPSVSPSEAVVCGGGRWA